MTRRRLRTTGRCDASGRERWAACVRAPMGLAMIGLTLVVSLASGCETERRVVSSRGILSGLPGASGGEAEAEVVAGRPTTTWESILGANAAEPRGAEVPGQPLRREALGGEVILISRSPAHLLTHLRETLQNEEDDLLYEQVLSDHTKEWFRDRGRDPREAVEYLTSNARDVLEFIAAVPNADKTIGADFRPLGDGAFELYPPGWQLVDRRFARLAMRVERGRFVLDGIRGKPRND